MTKALLCQRSMSGGMALIAMLAGNLFAAASGSSVRVLQRDSYIEPGSDAVAHIAEFTDSTGKVIREISIDNPKEGDRAVSALALASKNNQLLVLTKKTRSVSDHNPYLTRKNLDTEISWYSADGTRLGKKEFVWAAGAVAVAGNGERFAVVDAGFDPYDGDSQPDLSKASKEDLKIDLSYHVLYIFDINGREVWRKRFDGSTNSPPEVTAFSPSGSWLLLKSGGSRSAVNLSTKSEKDIQTSLILREITDEGTVIGWKKESDTGKWGTYEGRRVWIPGKRTERKFILKKDQNEFIRTEEIHES